LGIFLPLIAVNCSEGVIYARREYASLGEATVFALVLVWMVSAIVALSAIRENYDILMFLAFERFRDYVYFNWINGYAFMSFMGFRYKSIIKLK
jgi:Na+-transporting NADH:ubiquinone oxidoreductase subunit NqrE